MDFGIMFFSSAGRGAGGGKYDLLLAAARYADERGFACVWTPERHFHEFGGLFPNPAVTSAALAVITERVELRAGSLISPLHHTARLVEEWSVVDNLSRGRVAVSFGSGWNVNDFLFYPERYERRQAVMYEQIEEARRLWRGETFGARNSFGREFQSTIYPKPVQAELPVWVTSSGNAETFVSAGRIGANLLTHLIGQDIETLAGKIALYREARATHGFDPEAGKVSLMLHTFLGADGERTRAVARAPFREYLRSAVSLEEEAARGGGRISGGHKIEAHDIPADVREDLLDIAYERYSRSAALLGTPSDCKELIWRLESISVNEVACLVDFIADKEAVLESLAHLDELRAACSPESVRGGVRETVSAFMESLD
jgi:natural product biosynthesis luciferase-like monooxygenase protein